jgi:dipeptidyl aminopeptidase/acylaminoacyl peptidase
LSLLTIQDETVNPIARLLSKDYPQNLSILAEKLAQEKKDPNYPDTEDWIRPIDTAIIGGIFSLGWSPDGRYLAFSGQIDGPSSDLYVYDTKTQTTRRLTDDLNNIQSIIWSPDGKWILYENALPEQSYPGATLQKIRLDVPGGKPQILECCYWWMGMGWISSRFYLITGAYEGGVGHLRYLDIETDDTLPLWPYEYESYALDTDHNIFVVSGLLRDSDIGTYLVTWNGSQTKISPDLYYGLTLRNGAVNRYIGHNSDWTSVIGIAADGAITVISDRHETYTSISPDYRWLVVYNRASIDLYDEYDKLVHTFTNIPVSAVVWRPDSTGLFLVSDRSLYFMTIPDGEPELIEQCAPEACSFREFVWLP